MIFGEAFRSRGPLVCKGASVFLGYMVVFCPSRRQGTLSITFCIIRDRRTSTALLRPSSLREVARNGRSLPGLGVS
jgi:hypothetical protein